MLKNEDIKRALEIKKECGENLQLEMTIMKMRTGMKQWRNDICYY